MAEEIDDGFEENQMTKLKDEVDEIEKKSITPYNFGKTNEQAKKLLHVMDESIQNHWDNILDTEKDLKEHHKRVDIKNPIHKKSDLWHSIIYYRRMLKDMQIITSAKDEQIRLLQGILFQVADLIEAVGDVNTKVLAYEAKADYEEKRSNSLIAAIDTLDKRISGNYERVIDILMAENENLSSNLTGYSPIKLPKKQIQKKEEQKEEEIKETAPLKQFVNIDVLKDEEIKMEIPRITTIIRAMYDGRLKTTEDIQEKLGEIPLDTFYDDAIEKNLLKEDVRRD